MSFFSSSVSIMFELFQSLPSTGKSNTF